MWGKFSEPLHGRSNINTKKNIIKTKKWGALVKQFLFLKIVVDVFVI